MSIDLEFRQDLPEVQEFRQDSPEILLPRVKIESLRHIDGDLQEEEECRTPKSPRFSIPKTLSCPPAPKKPRRAAAACKRKLSELEFFEVVGREEIDSFFRLARDSAGGSNKRSRAEASKS